VRTQHHIAVIPAVGVKGQFVIGEESPAFSVGRDFLNLKAVLVAELGPLALSFKYAHGPPTLWERKTGLGGQGSPRKLSMNHSTSQPVRHRGEFDDPTRGGTYRRTYNRDAVDFCDGVKEAGPDASC
jgi:hypothetical protein